ncbi:carboxylesterase/lipase family protein [Nocardia sp. CA-119907]|uniref:carboxylesterase/lipase family protein n=1 Tax=Nocardia sp. CA-119907 TaxID=3239973 RepID=UPI003D96B08F
MIVETSSGRIRGSSVDGAHRFLGIPYAAPPVGELSFAAPVSPRPWTGVRDTLVPGAACPQPSSRLEDILGPMRVPQGPDCLNLNVWTPGLDGSRPVMVWLHGGGFSSGCGGQDWYDGAQLASRGDIVVVTINYRLGALGYLHLGELTDEMGDGNFGLLDMLAALRWVHREIHRFGGDSNQVTLVGQSAGALCGVVLMSAEPARGLFQRAILQSTPTSVSPASSAEATEVAEQYLAQLGLSPDQAHKLREEPFGRLLEAQTTLARRLAKPLRLAPPFQLTAKPGLVAEDPIACVPPDIDRFAGFTADEATAWPIPADLDHHTAAALAEGFGGQYPPDTTGSDPSQALVKVATDHYFASGIPRLGEGGYAYRFDWHPSDTRTKACHCIELPFVFGTVDAWRTAPMLGGETPPAYLIDTIQQAWLSFIQTGIPGPGWSVYRNQQDLRSLS